MPMNARLLRPRATGFSPKQIANLSAWWDASDSTTLFNATSGGASVASNGAVARWEDKSGNARHMTQATAANRPVRTVAALNGRDSLTSDSTDVLSGSHRVFSSAISVFAVSRVTNAAARQSLFEFGDYFGTGSFYVERNTYQTAGSRWGLYTARSSGGTAYDTTLSTSTSAEVLSLVCNAVSGTSVLTSTDFRINGNPSGTLNPLQAGQGNLWPDYSAQTAAISIVSGTPLVSEIIVYNRVVSSSERQKLEGYLAWKWGLQATLPYDHPYAASFPGYGTQATPTDADTLAYLSAVKTADGGTGVEVGVANAVDSFVKGCKADGTWTAIKASCILMGARTLSGALTPLVGTAPTNSNFVAADYNRKTGLVGNGSTKYLNSNRLDDADSQNDVHLSVYASTAANAFKMYGGTSNHYIYRDNTDVYFLSRNVAGIVGSSGSLTGFYGHSRANSASFASLVGGAANSHSGTSSVVTNTNVYLFGRNVSGAINSASTSRLAFYSIGSSLDLALLDTRISALYTAIGAAI